MSGPDHYREAERLLTLIEGTPEDSVGSVRTCATAAQAHATLALAAATADLFALTGPASGQTADEWAAALR